MTTSKYPYLVRGFNAFVAPFNSQGKIEDLPTYQFVEEPNDLAAIVTLLRSDPYSTMSARNLVDVGPANGQLCFHGGVSYVTPLAAGAATVNKLPELHTLDLKIQTKIVDLSVVKDVRPGVTEVINRWAEKSRVSGVRGWRSSAVRSPRWETDDKGYIVHTKVILGTAIFYSDTQAKVLVKNDLLDLLPNQLIQDDLVNLLRNLKNVLYDGFEIGCKHSHAGGVDLST